MEHKKHKNMFLRHLLAVPLAYVLFFPLALLDIFVELHHQIGFRLCSLPRVKRSNYIKIDRHKLEYLTFTDKINCAYCGYANGLANYTVRIGAETEKYWCGIRHKRSKGFVEPKSHKSFVKYGDESAYKEKYL